MYSHSIPGQLLPLVSRDPLIISSCLKGYQSVGGIMTRASTRPGDGVSLDEVERILI
jgi:hypothetical protein